MLMEENEGDLEEEEVWLAEEPGGTEDKTWSHASRPSKQGQDLEEKPPRAGR